MTSETLAGFGDRTTVRLVGRGVEIEGPPRSDGASEFVRIQAADIEVLVAALSEALRCLGVRPRRWRITITTVDTGDFRFEGYTSRENAESAAKTFASWRDGATWEVAEYELGCLACVCGGEP